MKSFLPNRLALALVCALGAAATTTTAFAQPPSRITQKINPGQLKKLPGSTHPLATPARDRGRVAPATPMRRMLLVLAPGTAQQAELDALIADQQNPGSAAYRTHLTPEQFAERFGANDDDVVQLERWLVLQGFHVDNVARGRQWIEFSGNAAQVEAAFHTQMRRYEAGGRLHVANASDISLPAALAPVVRGVLSLNDFAKQSLLTKTQRAARDPASGRLAAPAPQFNSGSGLHHLAPGDYAKLYDIAPVHAAGTTGSGVSIAIPGRTTIDVADVQKFRQIFGLPANDPVIITNGEPPVGAPGDDIESDLDLEWSGAVAPDATIRFVTSASTFATDGIDLSNAYIVDNKVAPIMSVSYGLCEAFLGDAGNAFYAALYQQAAVEGITVFVSAGDNGAAGCDAPENSAAAQNGLAVNGLASTPYNVAVGGTQFDEGGNDAAFWAAANALDFSSVLGYIPETIWNESCDPEATPDGCSNFELWSGSGGASAIYTKPSWQAGMGVPNDGARDLPDLSLTAAGGHDGYIMCAQNACQTHEENGATVIDSAFVIGGTSASSPALAGVMALVEQQYGSYLGLANDDFYKIAATDKVAKCDSSKQTDPAVGTACVFHDVTAGDNSVPGLKGYTAGKGFDLASGLGTLDVKNLLAAWNVDPPRPTVTTLASPSPTIQHGQPFPLTVTVAPASGTGTPGGFFALETDKYGAFVGAELANGTFDGNVDTLPGGTYNLRAHYAGDTVFAGSDSNAIPVQILPEDSTLSVGCITLNFANFVVDCFGFENYGQPTALTFAVAGLSGKGAATGTIDLRLDGTLIATLPVLDGKVGVEVDTLPAATGLLPGDHAFTATYNGDSSFNASEATPYPTTIYPGSPFSSVATTDGSGVVEVPAQTPLALVLEVHGPGVLEPTGTVQLLDRETGETVGPELTLGPDGTVATSIAFATPGTYTLCVNYSGDDNYNSVECNFSHGNVAELSVTVGPVPDPIFKNGFDVL